MMGERALNILRGGERAVFFLGAFFIYTFLAQVSWGQVSSLLTDQERVWLADHPEIRLAPDPQFLPIEYFDDQGRYVGIAADYVSLIENKLGVKFKTVQLKSWDEVLKQSRLRKVDLWGAATPTPQRREYMNFTQPFLELPAVILVRKQVTQTLSLDTLKGMRVAVISGYGIHDHILNEHPEIQLDVVLDIETGLKKVSLGMVDAMVTNIALATTYTEKAGITNLRIAGESGFVYRWALASRSDWPELNRILDKALAVITPAERQAIFSRWITLERSQGKSFKEIAISLAVALGLLGVAGILFWNRSLSRLVERRTLELKDELDERKQAESALLESQTLYREIFEKLAFVVRGTSAQTGEAFFRSLTYHLAKALDVKYAFIGKLIDSEKGLVKTQALWTGSGYSESLTYEIAKTPCEKVLEGEWMSFSERVQQLFPEDRFLSDLNIEGYQGFPIKDLAGNVLGHLGIMDNKPIEDAPYNRVIMKIFASRAFAELERGRVENKLIIAKERAEQASQAKSEFLSRMSHELRTPLNAILGFGQLMQMNKEALDMEQREFLDHILQSGGLLLQLINEVLDLSRVESSNFDLRIKKVEVGPVVEKALGLSLPMAREKGIQIINNISGKEETLVLADSLRLSQVMINLISNAIKYNRDRGTVVLDSLHLEDSRYRIEVQDTGLGIPKEKLETIFEPFERLDAEFSEVPGTGIGLTISQSLMAMMNGSIKAESTPDKGSCFAIELPLAHDTLDIPSIEPDSQALV
jgi:signal transduction histidine kinase/ABC-type amino acid transport substrate-binding protein